MDLQSILIYTGLAFIIFIAAKFADINENKTAIWFMTILLSLVAGLRSVDVGIDTQVYDLAFSHIANGNVNAMFGMEQSYIYICYFLLKVWNNNQFLFFVFSFISNGLILFRLWKEKNNISFKYAAVFFYVMFFFFSLNGVRQFVAVAIVFYATSFIKDGKYVKFIAFVIIASLFHYSALISIAYLIFELIFIRKYNNKRRISIYISTCFVGIIGISIATSLLNRYIDYFDMKSTSIGIMMIIKLALFLIAMKEMKMILIYEEKYDKIGFLRSSNALYYLMGIVLNSLSYLFSYMGRIGLYFYMFEGFFVGYLFKSKNTKNMLLIKFLYVGILLFYLYQNISGNSQGHLPYRFFWQVQGGF